jgi:acyl carrier protein
MDDATIRKQVRTHLLKTYLPGQSPDSLQETDDLLLVLNSLQILRMVIELESMFGITIENCDMTPDHLGTIQKIAALVQQKRS